MRTLQRLALALLCAAAATAASAATFTLDQLVNGSVSSFQSDNGQLTFSDFEVTKLKKLSGNLSLYTVTTVDGGFELSSSAFVANSGGLKQLNLAYKVSATEGSINGASMAIAGTQGTGRITVQKDIDSPTSDAGTFLLTLLTKNASILTDSDDLDPTRSFQVDESIRIKKVATLTFVRNSFTTTAVSEPATLSLLMAGIGGLAVYGRRRAR